MDLSYGIDINITNQTIVAGGTRENSRALDIVIGTVVLCFAIASIIGNSMIIQVIRRQLRKSVLDFILAQIGVVHMFGGLTAIFASVILFSGRKMFEYKKLDDVICWIFSLIWHIVVLITPMLLTLVISGRAVMQLAPLRYERIINMTYVSVGSAVCWILSCVVFVPFIHKGLNIDLRRSWGFPHYQTSSDSSARYMLLIGFVIPLLITESLLIILFSVVLINTKLYKVKKEKTSFIQAGLRNMLAQTMVPLPTVFESEAAECPTAPDCEQSVVVWPGGAESPSSYNMGNESNEQHREIFQWLDDSARVIHSSSHNVQSDSCVTWSGVSTPVSNRAASAAVVRSMHCGSLQSSTYSLNTFRAEMRSIFDSMTRIPSPVLNRCSSTKESQTKKISLHMSYSYAITHFMVTLYCVCCLAAREELMFTDHSPSPFNTYIKGCYYAAVYLNSGLTPVVYWTFSNKYRQLVAFYAYKLKIILTLFCRKVFRLVLRRNCCR